MVFGETFRTRVLIGVVPNLGPLALVCLDVQAFKQKAFNWQGLHALTKAQPLHLCISLIPKPQTQASCLALAVQVQAAPLQANDGNPRRLCKVLMTDVSRSCPMLRQRNAK